MVWPRFKVYWLSKDNTTGEEKEEVDRMNFASSTRAAENRIRWKGIVANLSVVPWRPSNVVG